MINVFAGLLQIILAILTNKGDSNYLSETRGRLVFEIRCTSVSNLEEEGTLPIALAPVPKGNNTQGEVENFEKRKPDQCIEEYYAL